MALAAVSRTSESPCVERTLWRLHHRTRSIVAFVRLVANGAELRIHLDGELLTASLFREGIDSAELATMATRARLTLERHGWRCQA